jgi:hypothetical protein
MLIAQFSALTILFSLCAWFTGHQASHCAAYGAGNVGLSHPVAFIMGLETFLGLIFLAWLAYVDGIAYAAGLLALSFVARLALVKLENVLGLTQRAWAISLSGIVAVPALLICLVMLVLHPISNVRYIDPMFGQHMAFVAVAALVPASAWYIWRYYTPRRDGQLADGVEPRDGGLRKWWKSLSDGTRGNIYLAALIVVIFTLTNVNSCSVRGTACYRALNYSGSHDIPDFDSLPDAGTQRSDEQFKKAVR